MMNGGYGHGMGMGMGGWLLMSLLFLVFWSGVVGLIIYLLRRGQYNAGSDNGRSGHFDAERILAERFARGEIDDEEFTLRRRALRRPE